MILDIPFYKNDGDGKQCLQVCIKTVLKHFLNKDYSLEELDKLTNREKDKWTWTPQAASALAISSLNVKFYSKTDLEPFLEGEDYLYKSYSKEEAEHMIKNSNIPSLVSSIKSLISLNCFEKRKLDIEEIENAIKERKLIIALLDWNKILGNEGLYQGHYVVLTGFDSDSFYVHQSGPENLEANMKIKKEIFMEAWNASGTDNDLIVVSKLEPF